MIYVLPTRQPPRLASSRNRSTSSLLNKDATEMEPCQIRGTTQPLVSRTGAGRQGNIFSFRSREKNVLDFSSPRTWLTTPVESTKRSRQVFGTSDLAECAVNCSYRSTALIDRDLTPTTHCAATRPQIPPKTNSNISVGCRSFHRVP